MIPRTQATLQTPPWQQELATAVRDPKQLLHLLELGPNWLPGAQRAAARFPLCVPRGFVARMRKGDPRDPLLRQVLPLEEETVAHPRFTTDPLCERDAIAAPGLLQKYRGRALLIATAACAVHCRYCFRRDFPYSEHAARANWRDAIEHLRADAGVHELILSGGDPLSLGNARLHELLDRAASVPHLQRLRIHTRLPVVLPGRVDTELIGLLAAFPRAVVVVIHANHPREIDDTVRTALDSLRTTGIVLLNQSVLLRGVNDDAGVLANLSETLLRAGVLPYYLHMLDPVAGTAHFAVAETTARSLYRALRARLPGYLVPRLVREVPGAAAKQLLAGEDTMPQLVKPLCGTDR